MFERETWEANKKGRREREEEFQVEGRRMGKDGGGRHLGKLDYLGKLILVCPKQNGSGWVGYGIISVIYSHNLWLRFVFNYNWS